MENPDVFVGLEFHKQSITFAIADAERGGEVRRYGEIQNTPEAVARFVKRLSNQHCAPEFVYEAGPCGYVLYRQLSELGLQCRSALDRRKVVQKRHSCLVPRPHRVSVWRREIGQFIFGLCRGLG